MRFNIDEAISRSEAITQLCTRWVMSQKVEEVALSEALGRIAACDYHARYDLPRCRVAALDGIAVKASDFINGTPDTSSWILGNDYALADTGDDFPDGFDTIISAENFDYNADGSISIHETYEFVPGACIRKAATLMAVGDILCLENEEITPEIISLLAAAGFIKVKVLAKPVVAFIPTGTELIEAGQEPVRGENVDSNSYMFEAYTKQWGGSFIKHEIVQDDKVKLEQALDWAVANSDIVIINGGSSRGSEDFNSYLLQEKSSFFVHGVKTVPGRPVGFAIIDDKPVINIPGPVNAASIAADWLLKGLLSAYLNQTPQNRLTVDAILDHNVWTKPGCEKVEKVVLSRDDDGNYIASAAPSKLADSLRDVNAIAYLPYPATYKTGDTITFEVLQTHANILL